jgi:uncharacterized protein involved in outer membrane biogenesis
MKEENKPVQLVTKTRQGTWIILILLISIVGAGILAYRVYADRLIKQGIERFASDALGVEVSINQLNSAFFEGKLTITGLNIKNPVGYKAPHAVEVGSIYVYVSNSDLIKERKVKIKDLQVASPIFYYEVNKSGDNFSKIQANLSRNVSSKGELKTQSERSVTRAEKLYISNMEIKDINVRVTFNIIDNAPIAGELFNPNLSFTIDKIQVKNAGGEAAKAQVMKQVFDKVAQAVKAEVTKHHNQNPLKKIEQNFKKKVDDQIKAPLKELEGTVKGIEKQFKDIFKG